MKPDLLSLEREIHRIEVQMEYESDQLAIEKTRLGSARKAVEVSIRKLRLEVLGRQLKTALDRHKKLTRIFYLNSISQG